MQIRTIIYQLIFPILILVAGCAPLLEMPQMDYPEFDQASQRYNNQPANTYRISGKNRSLDINIVKDFYVINKGSFCQLIIKMNKFTRFRANTLAKPNRLYVDLANTIIHPPKQSRTINDGFIKRIRTGQFSETTARIVLDTNEKVGFEIFKNSDQKELIIEFYPEKLSAHKLNRQIKGTRRIYSTKNNQFSFKKQTINKNTAATLVQELGLKIKTIIIDPGHGGKDPGAVGKNGIYEKDLTLDIALRLKRLLKREGSFNVFLTREKDVFIPLEERTAFANRHNGDLFISIHANAHRYSDRSGIETYYLALARDDDSRAVAAYENRFAQTELSHLEDILQNIMKNSKVEESVHFAEILQQCLVSKTRQIDRGVKTAGFFVLSGAKMPSVLTEVGFISNSRDNRLLRNDKYRQIIAQALFEGIEAYQNRLIACNK